MEKHILTEFPEIKKGRRLEGRGPTTRRCVLSWTLYIVFAGLFLVGSICIFDIGSIYNFKNNISIKTFLLRKSIAYHMEEHKNENCSNVFRNF